MIRSWKKRRLDDIEVQFSPQQWAITLADAIRGYASFSDFYRAIAKGEYRDSPFAKPFYALRKQVGRRIRGRKQEDIRNRAILYNRLRGEYLGLEAFINIANQEAETKSQSARLAASALAARLNNLILWDAIKEMGTSTLTMGQQTRGERCETESQNVLRELEPIVAPSSPKSCFLSAREWVDDAAVVLTDLFSLQVAAKSLQNDYFNGHPILAPDTELAIESAIRTILEMGATFSEYVLIKASIQARERTGVMPETARWNALVLDAEPIRSFASDVGQEELDKWKNLAKFQAQLATLGDGNDGEDFIWDHFRSLCDLTSSTT